MTDCLHIRPTLEGPREVTTESTIQLLLIADSSRFIRNFAVVGTTLAERIRCPVFKGLLQ